MATDPLPPSLLLLPAPPRPATRHLVDAAYRAPLTAVLTRLSREHARQSGACPTPVLVVAVAGSSILATASSSSERTDAEPDVEREPEPEIETETEAETSARARGNSSSVRWKPAQSLLASLYATIASICAERDIAAHLGGHEPGTVDARVVLVHGNGQATPSASSVQPGSSRRHGAHHAASNGTAVLDLATFAAQVRPWKAVFHPGGDAGRELLAAYIAHAQLPQSQMFEVDGDTTFPSPSLPHAQETRGRQHGREQGQDGVGGYSTVCLGGTFDHLHPGHKLLLEAAALLLALPEGGAEPCTIIIGISGDELLTKKEYASELQPWEARAGCVVDFLSTALCSGPTTKAARVTRVPAASHGGPSAAAEVRARLRDGAVLVRCVDIGDPFGPTVTEERIGAIVVSGETRRGGEAINEKRAARGWAPLDVYEIDVLDAGGDGEATLADKISSTEIRRRKALGRRCQDGEDREPSE